MSKLKERIRNGEAVIGCWLNLGSPITAEIVGMAGYDWVLIDLEHGAGGEQDVISQLQALSATPTAALVRVEGHDRRRIHRVLDMGAEGVICPHIDDAVEAGEAVDGIRYPPHGSRGVAKMVRATGFGRNFDAYYAGSNDGILGVMQIESQESLQHLDEIAAVDGVDVLFIGPADLTMSLGIFGQFDHPLFTDAVNATVTAARKAGKAVGILLFNPDDYARYHALGIRMIACGADATFVAEGSRVMASRLRDMRDKQNK